MNVSTKHISLLLAVASLFALGSCRNSDFDFDDYKEKPVYFATQTPVRTLTMSDADIDVDNSLDKQHRCRIGATTGGSYSGSNGTADIEVDNSLCNNIYFDAECTDPVAAMPASYYKLSSNQIKFGGEMMGFVDVELTDDFFNDPLSATKHFVIPVKITSQTGFDKIITGEYDTEAYASAPALTNTEAWKVAPQNYVLYCVTYMSKYGGYYLRRGTDNINGTEIKREFKNEYQIEDEVVGPVVTNALNKVTLTVKYLIDNVETYYDLVLTFDDSQKCNITSGTSGVAISGSGEFVDKGAGKYWGNTDRDQLTLSYTITDGANTIKTSDTLVSQRTGLKFETFSYTYKK